MKRTAWINCTTPPIRSGYYEVRLWETKADPAMFSEPRKRYFDGKHWREALGGYQCVEEERPGWHKKDEWRGVVGPNVELTGAARLHRAASSERSERGRAQG